MSFATSASRGDTSGTDRLLPFGPGPLAWAGSFYQLGLYPVKEGNEPGKGTAMARYLNTTVLQSSRKPFGYEPVFLMNILR